MYALCAICARCAGDRVGGSGPDGATSPFLAVLRGRRDERSWSKLDDNQRAIAMQLVAAGAITEDHGMLAPSDQLAHAFEPGQLFGLDW